MPIRLIGCAIAAGVLVAGFAAGATPLNIATRAGIAAQSAATDDYVVHENTIKQYCVTCHSNKLRTGGFSLQDIDMTNIPARAETWEKVIRKLRTGAMPPAGMPRPNKPTVDALASYLETAIDKEAAAHPNPGRTEAVHRLNRTEYRNAVRDMLALDVDAATILPADDQSYGFDNIAGVLKMSPTLLERYMSAAREVSRLAVGASKPLPEAETIRLRSDLSQYDQEAGLPFGTRGGAAIHYNFPQDAEYIIRAELLDLFGSGSQAKEPHQLEIAIDGVRAKVFILAPKPRGAYGGPGKGTPDVAKPEEALREPTEEELEAGYQGKPPVFSVRVPVKAGPHVVTATFVLRDAALAESIRQPFSRPHGEGDYLLYQPALGAITVVGPFDSQGAHDTPSRARIFTCHPATAAEEPACAKQIVSTLAKRAYRRPVNDQDVNALLVFYKQGRASGTFDAGIEEALRAVLMSPDFLYRVEMDAAAAPSNGIRPVAMTNGVHALSDLELASRLSFFLWSSIPDDELVRIASQGKLKDPQVLAQQVRRMLRDPRSSALGANFAGQWLRLRNVLGQEPNDALFPNFSDNLRQDFVKETEMFFQSVVQENRSVLDLLTADYSFMDESLAKFYGVQGVHGNEFRRVNLTDDNRRGLLGQASILTVTSYADRTSPVGRGKWILENVLGTPPPPPPPNVPALKENGSAGKLQSMRERMQAHRANPVCASCHSRMDPLGFGLENFDAVGRWRDVAESGDPIDASGTTPDGTKFIGPAELRKLLMRNPEQFTTVVTEKLFVYALGRGLEYYDAPAIRQIVRGAAPNYKFEDLVLDLVKSTPFMMRGGGSSAALTASNRNEKGILQ